MHRRPVLATLLVAGVVGALLATVVVSLPGLVGEGVTQCVDGTDGGSCRSSTLRHWPSGASAGAAALLGALGCTVLATPLLARRWLAGFLGC